MARRKVKWPSVHKLDAMYSAVNEFNEESTSFVMESSVSNCAPTNLLSMPTTIDVCSADDEYQTTTIPVESTEQEVLLTATEPIYMVCALRAKTGIEEVEELVENSEQGERWIVGCDDSSDTPALLSSSMNNEEEEEVEEEDRANLRSIMMDRQQEQPGSVSSAESNSKMVGKGIHLLKNGDLCSASTSTTLASCSSISQHPQQQYSVGSDHMHILSPPASNERIESGFFSSVGAPSSSMAGIYPAGAQQQLPSSMSWFGTPMLMHDSLSIIYPTPPTPMQQFSPQNVIVNAHLMAMEGGVLGAGNFSGQHFIQNLEDFCGSPPLEQFRQLQLTIDSTTSNDCSTRKGIAVEEVAVVKTFLESESFSGNLLEEGTDVEEKLNVLTSNKHHLGNTALEQLDNLKKALLNRANRQKIDQVPSYKQISDNQRQAASREKRLNKLTGNWLWPWRNQS
uniref:Uncharacterized protein n=1 Tax=Ditylenchus dipsaci TaxID=166011 RepID=A0A915EJK0_9BILA